MEVAALSKSYGPWTEPDGHVLWQCVRRTEWGGLSEEVRMPRNAKQSHRATRVTNTSRSHATFRTILTDRRMFTPLLTMEDIISYGLVA